MTARAEAGAGAAAAPTLPTIGIAAGLVALLLFGILYVLTDAPAALVAGCGGGALLLGVSVSALKRVEE